MLSAARISKMWLSKVNKPSHMCMAANALKRQYGNTLFNCIKQPICWKEHQVAGGHLIQNCSIQKKV